MSFPLPPPQQAPRLALAAVVCAVAVAGDVGELGAAGGARLVGAAVDFKVVADLAVDGAAHALAEEGDGLGGDAVDGVVEGGELGGREGRALLEGVDAGGEKDLVGVGVADAGDGAAARQHALDLAAEGLEPVGERLQGEGLVEHVGALLAEAGGLRELLRQQVVDHAHLVVIGVAEMGAVGERERQVRPRRDALRRVAVLERAAEHRVDDEGAPGGVGAAGEFDAEELATPPEGVEGAARDVLAEALEGRGEGAQDEGTQHVGARD